VTATAALLIQSSVWAQPAPEAAQAEARQALVNQYCVSCHNDRRVAQGAAPVSFEHVDAADVSADTELWEQAVRKLRLGMMPPVGSPRPALGEHRRFVTQLETALDEAAASHPDPGRPAVRRLTATEYRHAVSSLLAVNADERWLLFPPDDVDQDGFATNGDVLSVSPALFDRYLSAANRISRLAVGDLSVGPGFAATTYDTPRLLYQDDRMSDDLPFGSRGGLAVRHYFPLDV